MRARLARPAVLAGALVVLVVALPAALAHGEGGGLDDQLVENGDRLVVGAFTAPQPGALVVVPYVDGALPCTAPAEADYRVAFTRDANGDLLGQANGVAVIDDASRAGVSFAANSTALVAYFDLPRAEGYAGFAVDTHDATRALTLMQQEIFAVHSLVGVIVRGPEVEVYTGALGVPYPVEGTATHDMSDIPNEGGGLRMTHDDSFLGAGACAGEARGHVAMNMLAEALPDSLAPGRLVHAVALYEPTLSQPLPRPLDGTTGVLQLNLYLARASEDPERVRAALDPSLGLRELLPLGLLAVGLLWSGRR